MKSVKMIQKRQGLAMLIAVGVLSICASQAQAALSVVNGDFETGAANTATNVPAWFDMNTASNATDWWTTTSEVIGASPTADTGVILGDGNGTIGGAMGTGGRWLYQSIGTKESTGTYYVTFDYGQPNDGNTGRSVGVQVDIYQGTFPGAIDDVDIATNGLTLITSLSTPYMSQVGEGSYTNYIMSLDLSSANTTDELWIRLANLPGMGTDGGAWVVIDNVAIVPDLPAFHPIAVSPTGTGVTNPVTLEAVVVDWGTTFSSATMYLDGGSVSTTVTNNGPTNIITYAAPTLDAGTTHTGLVVVTGMDASAVSNEWTFTMGGNPGFGIYISTTTNNPATGVDDIFQFAGAQSDSNNCNTIINTNGADVGTWNDASTYVAFDRDSSQGQLFTTGSGPSYELSSVWVKHVAYNSTYGNGTFANLQPNDVLTLRIVDPSQADTTNFVVRSEVLNVISNSLDSAGTSGTGLWIEFRLQTPVTLSGSSQYGFDITSYNDAFDSYFELSGISTNVIDGGSAYTTGGNAGPNTGTLQSGDRTFMVALTQVGPAVTPNITAFTVSGGSATLMWDSETGVNYGVMHKTALTSGTWTEVTNVAGAAGTTMATVPAASSAEFFQIEGN